MTGSRTIRQWSAALACLALTLAGSGGAQAPADDCVVHEKGRVRARLPLDGNLGSGGTTGLWWPGRGGDAYLGRGEFVLGFRGAAGGPSVPVLFETVTLEHGELFDGCNRGKRYPHPLRDDDGDGMVDEDPLDGADNDGDGFIDEDFAAIGDEMRVTVAVDRETGLVRRQCSYTWTSGHVRDFIGFTTTLHYPREATGLLRDIEAILYLDFDIGGVNDPSRGSNDHFFVVGKEWEGGTLNLPAARDGERFVALLLLGAEGPNGEELGAETLLMRAAGSPVELFDIAEGDDGEESERRSGIPRVRVPASIALEEGGGEPQAETPRPGAIDGDGAMMCLLQDLPEFWPGDELTVNWAIVFGASEGRLIRNALRALETYEGVPDGEGELHRWIVPARRAGRIELEAKPAYVWSQGCRQPAATITLPPPLGEEEVEWLRGTNTTDLQYQQVGDKILVTVEGTVDVPTVLLEGQMTDGTIFSAALQCEMLIGGEENGQQEEGLPDESMQLYPNPFLTNLNIGIRIFDSALTEEGAGSSTVRIYDVRGRLVRTILEQGPLHPGDYQRTWDGLDEYGNEAAPGVYYVKLQIGDRSVTKRVILLR